MPPKIGVHPRDDAFIHAMPAYLSDSDAVGLKWVAGYPSNQPLGIPYIHGLLLLSEAGTGRPLAVMDATWITEIRTAAASMLGIRALAEGPVEAIGILGCGRQGHVHLELAEQVFPTLRRVAALRPPPRARRGARGRPPEARDPGGIGGRGDRARGARGRHHAPRSCASPSGRCGARTWPDAMVACAVDFDATLSEDLFEDAGLFVVDDVAQYRYYRQQGYFAGYPPDAAELADVLAETAPAPARPEGLRAARHRAGGRGRGGGGQPARGRAGLGRELPL